MFCGSFIRGMIASFWPCRVARSKGAVMRVLMLDDHVLFIQGLRTLLNVIAPTFVIDTASRLPDAIAMARNTVYELVLLDWHLADDGPGEVAIRTLREAGCMARIVVVSAETKTQVIRSAIDQGAAGFIPKRHDSEALLGALNTVVNGGIYLPPEAQQASTSIESDLVALETRFHQLTQRQADVYRAAARGLPNKLIARELGIAESTVKTHLAALFAELNLPNRAALAYHASREGIRVG
jgi:DNA-binding NarL/FixJ family response regulator